MKFWQVEHIHVHRIDDRLAKLLTDLTTGVGLNQTSLEKIMVDTTKLLAEVARAVTMEESLLALNAANTTALKDLSDRLDVANASVADLQTQVTAAQKSGDPKALAALQAQVADLQDQITKAQADADKAATDLSAESSKADAALNANVPPAAPVSAPGTAAPLPGTAPDVSAPPAVPADPAPAPATPST